MLIEMKFAVTSLVTSLAIAASANAQVAVQWPRSAGGNGHWYRLQLVPNGIGWTTAKAQAIAMGGHLATVTSSDESAFVFALANRPEAFPNSPVVGPWIGGYLEQVTGMPATWKWVNGESWQYTNWLPPNPDGPGTWNENRTCLTTTNGKWNDFNDSGVQPCCKVAGYVVEWEADCNGDGVVDFGQIQAGILSDANANGVPDCCDQATTCAMGTGPIEWRVADGGNGHWYQLRTTSSVIDWSAANSAAIAIGGHLASVLSAAEDLFVFAIANQPNAWSGPLGAWLGGKQVPGSGEPVGTWIWSSGEPWGYVGPGWPPNNGGPNAPPWMDENRLHYIDRARVWNDLPENGAPENNGGVHSFIVEWSADCNGDRSVDFSQIRAGQLVDDNANNVPDVCECSTHPELHACCFWDVVTDNRVDGADLAAVLSHWGPVGSDSISLLCDFDHSGTIDGFDLGTLLAHWGPCAP
jgi:hypothetical protein